MTTSDTPPSRSADPAAAADPPEEKSLRSEPLAADDVEAAEAAEADENGARSLLGKLNKVAAPPDLASRVPELIQRRSAGRVFGKRRLMDRVPMEWLSLVMLALLALIYAILRMAPAVLNND